MIAQIVLATQVLLITQPHTPASGAESFPSVGHGAMPRARDRQSRGSRAGRVRLVLLGFIGIMENQKKETAIMGCIGVYRVL